MTFVLVAPVIAELGATKSVPATAAVIALVPLPFTSPDNVVAPVPPLATLKAVVKLNDPALKDVPITPLPLILKLELACCVVPLAI